jgi:lipopolysaccharide/colanic/teichoic acid biosynthesis glycosyltransferase
MIADVDWPKRTPNRPRPWPRPRPTVVARLHREGDPPWKGVSDMLMTVVLAILSLPVMLAAMGLVRLTSPGPVLYRQARLGRNGRPFTIYKIRTMVHDCERQTGPRWSRPGDPRVTPVGRFLRSTHIDELPQLWNILRGEMSLVGPRPERPEIVAELERVIPRYRERLAVRPGLTGLAQVLLPPDTDLNSVHRKLACDLHYIERLAFGLEARIVLGTALRVAGVPSSVLGRWLGAPDPSALPVSDEGNPAEREVLQAAQSV